MTAKIKRINWTACPRLSPNSNPGMGNQEAPGGLRIHFVMFWDKFSGLGEEIRFGELVSADIHCFVLRNCSATSSPTLKGTWTKINLHKIVKKKKSLSGEISTQVGFSGRLSKNNAILTERKTASYPACCK